MRGLVPLLLNRTLVKVTVRAKQLRFPFPANFAERLTWRTVISINRRAKYILLTLDSGETLLLHLGMSGRLVKTGHDDPIKAHDHVIFETDRGDQVRFHDPRRFGIMDIVPKGKAGDTAMHKLLDNIGPEPLGPELTATYLQQKLAGKSASIKTLLLDQRLIAGLGNIYVSEALFRARINPEAPGGKISAQKMAALAPAIKEVLEAAISAGGTSMRDYVQADGQMGNFQSQFAVYGRTDKPCPACQTPIRRIIQAGRSTFYCPKCQKA